MLRFTLILLMTGCPLWAGKPASATTASADKLPASAVWRASASGVPVASVADSAKGPRQASVSGAVIRPAAKGQDFKAFSLDGYFSCEVPQKWQLSRDAEEQKRGVFQIELTGPHAEKVPVTAYVSYFSKTNKYFKDYKDYVDSNSTDDLGIAPETDKYGPVKTTALGKRKAFEFEREKKEYLHPESKSDESVMLKEKFYVLPAKDGFFVFHFSAPKAVFSKHLPVFERVARTFKGLP